MTNKFKNDYAVYLCPHVFSENKPILEVVRDPDGCWQFFCGQDHDFENEECHTVGIGHLIEIDLSIQELVKMKKGTFAERKNINSKWSYGELSE